MPGTLMAQASETQPGSGDTNAIVSWVATPASAPRRAGRALIGIRATIRDGWHVYAQKQSPTGPTPLVVAVERNDIALPAGAPGASRPTVAFEPAFGFATPYYAGGFSLTVPVRLRPGLAGRQLVPVSIRYQSCDGRICLPPRTVHLTAPVDVRAES